MENQTGAATARRTALAALSAALALHPARAAAAEERDAYAPLTRYEGAWIVDSSSGKTSRVENRCARTGLFFVCEQMLNGKSEALVVFLPVGATDDGQTYRTQTLRADAGAPGPWYRLTIDGDRWVYASGSEGGAKHALRERTVDQFSGEDHIHFEVQTSRDGEIWTTTRSGDERRARP